MVVGYDTPASVTPGKRLRLLGGFQLELRGVRVNVPANGQRLLAYLGIYGAKARAAVAGALWPDVSEHNAHGSLRTTIWRIHRCGAEFVATTDGRLAVADDVTVDTREFAAIAHEVIRTPVALGTTWPRLTADSELLPGWYDDWIVFERERLRQLRLHTLEAMAAALAERGEFAEALDTALEAIRLEPLRESTHRVVVQIHLAEGNVAEAVRHFGFVKRLLAEELGVAPSAQLAQLLTASHRAAVPTSPP